MQMGENSRNRSFRKDDEAEMSYSDVSFKEVRKATVGQLLIYKRANKY